MQLVNLDAPKKALARVLSQHLVPTANLRSPQWCDASIPAGLILYLHSFILTQNITPKLFNQLVPAYHRQSLWLESILQKWNTHPAGTRSLRGG